MQLVCKGSGGRTKEPKKRVVGFYMKATEEDHEKFSELARRLGTGKSEAIRIAVSQMLDGDQG